MGRSGVSERIERVVREAATLRREDRTDEALARLSAAEALLGQAAIRRELQSSLHSERGLAHLVRGDVDRARAAFLEAVEAAGPEVALADPARASLASLDLMAGAPAEAQRRLAERRRDRRATLLAQARVHLYQGANHLAEGALQACEQAPGGSAEIDPPSAVLRSLGHLWEGRTEEARLLHDGVANEGSLYWDLVRTLLLRAFWKEHGDGRYLALALGTAEQLRFEARTSPIPGLHAAAAGLHALLLAVSGQVSLSLEAADESLSALGPLGLPEWPRAAVLHDLAIVYRDAGEAEHWQRVLDLQGEVARGVWPERVHRLTGPRALGALSAPVDPAREGEPAAADPLSPVALALLEAKDSPETAFLRAFAGLTGAHGARWVDRDGHAIAASGSGWTEGPPGLAVDLPSGDRLLLRGTAAGDLAGLDLDRTARLAAAARNLGSDRRRIESARLAADEAETRRREAQDALERARRGPAAAVTGGRFPSVAGRSPAIRNALDRLGLLATGSIPILVEGPAGSGRRHLARAFAADVLGTPGAEPPILDLSLVPEEAMATTLLRLEAEGRGGPFVLANAEHLTAECWSRLAARAGAGEIRGRLVVTLDAGTEGPIAAGVRKAFSAGRVVLTPLAARLEDLPQLVDALALSLGRRPADVTTAARAVLARRTWPENVESLRALLVDASVRAGKGAILPEHLAPPAESAPALPSPEALAEAVFTQSLDLGYHEAVRTFRSGLLRRALEVTEGNRTRAAELLGLQRTYFMRLIKDLEVTDPATAPRADGEVDVPELPSSPAGATRHPASRPASPARETSGVGL